MRLGSVHSSTVGAKAGSNSILGRGRTLSANLLRFLQWRIFLITFARTQHFENSLLVFLDPGDKSAPIVFRSVDLLRHQQSTAVESLGYDVIVILAMPICERAQVLHHRS